MYIRGWRRLGRAELAYLTGLQEKRRVPAVNLANASVCILHEGNFTTAMLRYGSVMKVGTAKRNPTDGQTPEVGDNLALVRALRSTRGVRV